MPRAVPWSGSRTEAIRSHVLIFEKPGECLERHGVIYVFDLSGAIVAAGNLAQGQQRVRISYPGGVLYCRKISGWQCKSRAGQCNGAIAQLCESSPCAPDACEQRLD